MRLLKDRRFLMGLALGVLGGPIVLGKVAPGLKAKIPG